MPFIMFDLPPIQVEFIFWYLLAGQALETKAVNFSGRLKQARSKPEG